jgi:hypothetical protein
MHNPCHKSYSTSSVLTSDLNADLWWIKYITFSSLRDSAYFNKFPSYHNIQLCEQPPAQILAPPLKTNPPNRGGSRNSEGGGGRKNVVRKINCCEMASEASNIQLGVPGGPVSPPENSAFFMIVEVIWAILATCFQSLCLLYSGVAMKTTLVRPNPGSNVCGSENVRQRNESGWGFWGAVSPRRKFSILTF